MVDFHRLLAGALLVFSSLGAASAPPHKHELLTIHRADQRLVAATAYWPQGACQGIAIISPGAGGAEDGYRYLGEALAGLRYLVAVVGHHEGGRQALRARIRGQGLHDGLAELLTDGSAYGERLKDIAALKQWAKVQCGSSSAMSVLVGHSMGAATTMIEAGARNRLGVVGSNAFDAYIALSPQGSGAIFPKNAWAPIQQPVLMLTGTRDDALGGASWQTRTEPFDDMAPGCKWLGVIQGGTHAHFAGNGLSRRTESLTTQLIADFLRKAPTGNCEPSRHAPALSVRFK